MLSDHTHQDIARSGYADMVHDDERNRAYNNAIELSVSHLITSQSTNPDGNRFFKCCDIGTGSGLLSMMIVRSFKKLNYEKFHVQTFEAFQPMAECAKKVIEQNDMSEHITVIPIRSDLYPKDEPNPQFDLLVAELLDTELIGEGCLEAYRHALHNLCSKDCLFVPHAARIYLEPVASARLFSRHAIGDLEFPVGSQSSVKVKIDDQIKNCPGMAEIDDMQVSALREGEDFTRFSEAQVAFEFSFGMLEKLKLTDYKKLTFPINERSTINEPPVIIMWWDIIMYDSSLVSSQRQANSGSQDNQFSWELLSCAPTWARSADQLARDQFIRDTYGRDVWREHWIQGVYYFSSVPETRALVGACGSQATLTVHAYHDAYSMWFDLKQCQTKLPNNCGCGIHRNLTRSQLAFLSDANQMAHLIHSTVHPLLVHNCSTIRGEIEFERRQEGALGDIVLPSRSGPKWMIRFQVPPPPLSLHPNTSRLDDLALAGEIPWSNIMMKYLYLRSGRLIEPVKRFEIKFTQVHFDNLNRIRTNVRQCEGFNLSHLDDMINYSSKYVDKELEAHYLWEYPCTRIDSTDYTVFSALSPDCRSSQDNEPDAQQQQQHREREKINSGTYWRHFRLPLIKHQQQDGQHHNHHQDETGGNLYQKGWALAFWAELQLEHTQETLSLGPIQSSKLGTRMEWNRNCKQLVYFLHDHPLIAPQTVSKSADEQPSIHLDVGLSKYQLMVQRAVDYNTSPLKSKHRLD